VSSNAYNKKRPALRHVSLRLVRDAEHVVEVLERAVLGAKSSIWIATANLKDVHIEGRVGTRARAKHRYESLFDRLCELVTHGVEVRILHASEPSRALQGRLALGRNRGLSLRQCSRVHQKIVAVDGGFLYLGSANFTGAGLGAKGEHRRNFELGIVSDDDLLLDEVQAYFDSIWSGKHCKTCRLRSLCRCPLDTVTEGKAR
jgi:phosphatidylserine/phosphatidylglycerophosphate/cardiolipin synthase-like enzyme